MEMKITVKCCVPPCAGTFGQVPHACIIIIIQEIPLLNDSLCKECSMRNIIFIHDLVLKVESSIQVIYEPCFPNVGI